MMMPSVRDIRLAPMNHMIVRTPMRPSVVLFPMCATPATRVENTRGAMIMRMRRRNRSVTMEK